VVLPSQTVFLQNHSLGRKNVGIHFENYLLEINMEISGSAELVRKQTTKERAYQTQNKMLSDALLYILIIFKLIQKSIWSKSCYFEDERNLKLQHL
jgi:hypothetical protein